MSVLNTYSSTATLFSITILANTIATDQQIALAAAPGAEWAELKEARMIRGVKFLGICVSDQDRALAFYTQKLGFTIQTDQPFDGGQRWIELGIPGADTGVVLFTPKGQEDRIGSFVNASLWTDDVEATYQQLKAKGVEFTAPPVKQPWGTSCIFKDPDGNQFVLGSK